MSDGGSELPLHSPKTLGQENEDGGILGDSWQSLGKNHRY